MYNVWILTVYRIARIYTHLATTHRRGCCILYGGVWYVQYHTPRGMVEYMIIYDGVWVWHMQYAPWCGIIYDYSPLLTSCALAENCVSVANPDVGTGRPPMMSGVSGFGYLK